MSEPPRFGPCLGPRERRSAHTPENPNWYKPPASAHCCSRVYVVMGAGWVWYRGHQAEPIPAFANAIVLLGAGAVIAAGVNGRSGFGSAARPPCAGRLQNPNTTGRASDMQMAITIIQSQPLRRRGRVRRTPRHRHLSKLRLPQRSRHTTLTVIITMRSDTTALRRKSRDALAGISPTLSGGQGIGWRVPVAVLGRDPAAWSPHPGSGHRHQGA